MDFGVGIPTASDSWKVAQRAEALGFTHAWFFDTQMITADCFVSMAVAAMKTSRIRLGTGVLVPSNRIAAVTANAFATLNGLAPGRIDFGVGTGFSARRAMGLGAMKLAEMEEYIRVVYALLAGETVETPIEGKRRKIRFLNPEVGLFNIKDLIPLHISAYGPRSQALTAKLDAHWKCFIQDVDGALAALDGMKQAWIRPAARPTISMQRLGCVAACCGPARRPTASARWRRLDRAPRHCCTAPPTPTSRVGRTRCRSHMRTLPRQLPDMSRWRGISSRPMRAISKTTAGIFCSLSPRSAALSRPN